MNLRRNQRNSNMEIRYENKLKETPDKLSAFELIKLGLIKLLGKKTKMNKNRFVGSSKRTIKIIGSGCDPNSPCLFSSHQC